MKTNAISEIKRQTKQLYSQHVNLGIENAPMQTFETVRIIWSLDDFRWISPCKRNGVSVAKSKNSRLGKLTNLLLILSFCDFYWFMP